MLLENPAQHGARRENRKRSLGLPQVIVSWDELAAPHTAPLSGHADANAKDGSRAWPDEECLWLLGATFDEVMRVGELNFEEKACFLARFRRCGAMRLLRALCCGGFGLGCLSFPVWRWVTRVTGSPPTAPEADRSAVITSSRSVGPRQDL